MLYLKELSEYKSRLPVPVSFRPHGAGFSYFAFIMMSQCFTTVAGGVAGVSSLLQEITNIKQARDNITLIPVFLRVFMIINFSEEYTIGITSKKRKGCL